MHIMENIMEKQTNGREELSHLRVAWYLKAIEGKPAREQWEMFKEKLTKVRKRAGQWLGAKHSIVKHWVWTLARKQTKRHAEWYFSKNIFWSVQCDRAFKPRGKRNQPSTKVQESHGSVYLQPCSQIQKQRSEWMLPEDAGREEGTGCC